MSQNYNYPSSSDVTLTGSTNGAPAPTTTIVVGGVSPAGNTEPLELDSSGDLKVTVTSTSGTANVNLAQVGGATIALGSAVEAASIPVVIASNQVVPVSATALPLPAGASTSALQTQISGQLPTTLGAHVTAASLAVNIASDQVVPVSVASLPLPTGGSTLAAQTNGSQKTQIVDGSGNVIGSTANHLEVSALQEGTWNINNISGTVSLPTGASTAANQTTMITDLAQIATNTAGIAQGSSVTGQYGYLELAAVSAAAPTLTSGLVQPLSLTLAGALRTDSSAVTQPISAASLPLPTGAATSANQATEITSLASIVTQTSHLPTALGQTTMSASLPVVIASNQSNLNVTQGGKSRSNAPIYNVYSTTNVTTSAYVQLVASTTSATNLIEIFDSSGQSMIIGVGASGSEVIQLYTTPGGNGQVPLAIPAGSRVAIKALTANATAGYLTINFYS